MGQRLQTPAELADAPQRRPVIVVVADEDVEAVAGAGVTADDELHVVPAALGQQQRADALALALRRGRHAADLHPEDLLFLFLLGLENVVAAHCPLLPALASAWARKAS